MTQEIEIEFKNLVTEEEFSFLLSEFKLDKHQFIVQQNHYFDTTEFSLKNRKAALRIRYKNKSYTLTLKQTIEEGILETHQVLTVEEATSMLEGHSLIQGQIYDIIKELGIIPEELHYLGMLETNRAEIDYLDGTLVFDHSHYFDQDDYEIEFEASNYQQGQQDFNRFLKAYRIPIRETDNKIRRFFKAKGLEGLD